MDHGRGFEKCFSPLLVGTAGMGRESLVLLRWTVFPYGVPEGRLRRVIPCDHKRISEGGKFPRLYPKEFQAFGGLPLVQLIAMKSLFFNVLGLLFVEAWIGFVLYCLFSN